MDTLLNQSCRVYLHDLGKFAQRADIGISPDKVETHRPPFTASPQTHP